MEEPQGSKPELKIYHTRYKKDGSRETISVPTLEPGSNPTDGEYAIVVKHEFTKDQIVDESTLIINSPHILAVFREVVVSHPTVSADFNQPFEMDSPFQMLLHFWNELFAFKRTTKDDDQRLHLSLLLEFMQIDLGHERSLLTKSIDSGLITFDTLWAIFRPRDIVITYAREQPWLLRVIKTAYEENTRIGPYMEVHCTFTDFDGKSVGQAKKVFQIIQKRCFGQGNPSPIIELPVYPRTSVVEGESLEKRLLQRGNDFLALQGKFIKQCDGPAEYLYEAPPSYWHPEMDEFPEIWLPYTENGRVIVDRHAFRRYIYQEPVRYKPELTEIDRILCPPFVQGFSVSKMDWCRFWLSTLQDVDWKSNAFDTLMLPDQQRHLVEALVTSHDFPESDSDQARQKGKGLVVLLYGPPGSGKTLTAECAAEATKKPLFSTSLHNLNKYNHPYHFERALRNILRWATMWRAVVLFDEADVFLEHRSDEAASDAGATRNALVAVFLRHMEYFSGIVFLTTNRIRVFDLAMKSRVHLALEYFTPGPESRKAIWAQCFQNISSGDVELDMDKVLLELSQQRLNGREISNTVKTAHTLARFEKVPLNLSHLQSILGVWHDFERSLRKEEKKSLSFSSSTKQSGSVQQHIRRGSILTSEPEITEV